MKVVMSPVSPISPTRDILIPSVTVIPPILVAGDKRASNKGEGEREREREKGTERERENMHK